jgi:hypothetical protein
MKSLSKLLNKKFIAIKAVIRSRSLTGSVSKERQSAIANDPTRRLKGVFGSMLEGQPADRSRRSPVADKLAANQVRLVQGHGSDARVIHKHIQFAESAESQVDNVRQIVAASHVRFFEGYISSKLFDPLHHFLQGFKPSGTEYQLCSSLGEVNGRCFSDPTTCSGNDHYFISDSRHEFLLRSVFAGKRRLDLTGPS